jgi:hypothetical protein
VFVIGADPKNPAKNRVIITVWMSLETAVAKEKTAAKKYGIRTANFRP